MVFRVGTLNPRPEAFVKDYKVEVAVRYKGPKKSGMGVVLPIGVKNKSAVKHTLLANPIVMLTKNDAEKLVSLDPLNFEILEEVFVSDEVTIVAPKRPRGRPKKEAVNAQ